MVLPGIGSKDYLRVGLQETRFAVPMEEAREDFKRQHALAITNLLEPALLAVLKANSGGTFSTRLNAGGQVEYQDPARGAKVMDMILSRREILDWMEAVSGRKNLRMFGGEVFKISAGRDDHLTWHDDLMDRTRRVVLVVRVGEQDYEGGKLQMRKRDGETFLECGYPAPGSAIVMEMGEGLQHRVLPVTAGGPRLMYGGWAHV